MGLRSTSSSHPRSFRQRARAIEPLERRTLLSTTLAAIADADVQNLAVDVSLATANFGADEQLRVRATADASETFESFVTFDIGALTGVGHAMLKMRGGQTGTVGEPALVGAFASFTSTGFVEGTGTHSGPLTIITDLLGAIHYNNRPATSATAADTAVVTAAGDYYWDLTNAVRAAKTAGQSSVTVALRQTGGNAAAQVAFNSRESFTIEGANAPQLIVEENVAGPVATFAAPDVTAEGGTSQQVVVTYTDTDAIDLASLDAGDVDVRAAGGAALEVIGVSVAPQTDANSAVVTYTLAAPGGTWDAADAPAYTTLLASAAVADALGNPATGGPDTFLVDIDVTLPPPPPPPPPTDIEAPVAAITEAPATITEEGGLGTTIGVTFTDNVGAIGSAITATTLVITPVSTVGGSTAPLQVLDTDVQTSADGKTVTALFNVIAPGGTWDPGDNGTYEIRVAAGAVTDSAGNASAPVAQALTVAVPVGDPVPPPNPPGATDTTGPATTVVPVEPVGEAGVAEQQVRVTFVDDASAIDLATIQASDLIVTAPDGTVLDVIEFTVNPPEGGQSVTATYTLDVPGGTWDFDDNGVYTVSVVAGAAADAVGNPSVAASATFEVVVPSPQPPVDPNFGGGTSTVNAQFVGEAAVSAGDGKVLIAGRQGDLGTGTSRLVLQRLNADGSLDTAFGSGGKVLGPEGANEAAFAVAIDADGNIVVAGRRGDDLLVARFKSNGAVDTRFGTNGSAVADFGGGIDVAYSLLIAPDGSVLAAGGSTQPGAAGDAFAFARFTRDGRADTTFGTAGRALFAQGAGGNIAGAVTVDAAGRVVAAGPGENGTVAVVRLNANGTEDTTFGTNGILVINGLATRTDLGRPDRSIGIAALGDGSVLVTNHDAADNFAIAKVKPDGTLDASFGTSGVATIDFGGTDDADSILVQGSGEILVLGTTTAGGNKLAVAALGADGSLLRGFGDDGKLTLDATPVSSARELHLGDLVLRAFGSFTTDGRLVVGASNQAPAAVSTTPLRRLNVPGSGSLGTFGQVAGSKKGTKLSFMDADGTVVTISMKGAGTGQAFYDGSSLDLVLSGVSNSSLVVRTRGGSDGRTTLRHVQADGALKSVSAKTTDLSGTFAVTNGGLGKVSVGTLTGTLASAGSITSLAFAGDVRGKVFSGANYGVNGKAGGSGTAADSFAAGRIGKVTVAGTAVGATFAAGVNPVNSRFLDGNDVLVGGTDSSIGTISVRRGADASTRFVAGAFGKRAKLPQAVDPTTDPRFMVL